VLISACGRSTLPDAVDSLVANPKRLKEVMR